ncbi:methyl-accepting chemotaxis protein [Kiloniella sp. b19]|uniref:methyl-accepting chemotaxis protein n=1 Tax=Kiloniella sp. GXU_MW_B19 TaxID=3141326 RepID=UPI0031E3631C
MSKLLRNSFNLTGKILTSVVITLAIGLTATTAFVVKESQDAILDVAEKHGQELAGNIGSQVRADIDVAMTASRTMAETFLSYHRAGITDREVYREALKGITRNNPDFAAVWSGWEPDALDGRDADFANTPESNASGRFIDLWFLKNATDLGVRGLNIDKGETADWYDGPRKARAEVITEPYAMELAKDSGTEAFLATSVVVPLIKDGTFIGTVGIDFNLQEVQDKIAEIRPYDEGIVTLITNNGVWAAYPDKEQIGKPVEESSPQLEAYKDLVAKGESASWIDYSSELGKEALYVLVPLTVGQSKTPWAIAAIMPLDKVQAGAASVRDNMIVAAVVLTVLMALIIAFLITALMSKPLKNITGVIEVLSRDETDVEIKDQQRSDEIGVLAKALEQFRNKLIEVRNLQSEQLEKDRQAEQDRRETLLGLANQFEQQVQGVVGNVSSSSDHLLTSAESMSAVTDNVSKQATVVSTVTEEASGNVATVASATEELSASIGEINAQIARAVSVSQEAVKEADQANSRVKGLSEAALKIGDVIQLINDIAEQTNLLALNATIEAARAGDAGKGFAVVASEVKSLANQTAKATEEITSQISSIQDETDASVEAIGGIGSTISQINEISTVIASAMEEQGAATQEISRNVQEAAAGTSEVRRSITEVNSNIEEAGNVSQSVLTAAQDLQNDAVALTRQVDEFVNQIRAS